MALSGNQITRSSPGGSGHAYATFTAKAETSITRASFAVQSLISSAGQAVRSALDITGVSVAVTGFSSFAVQSTITADGASVRAAFDTSGVGVTGKMQG